MVAGAVVDLDEITTAEILDPRQKSEVVRLGLANLEPDVSSEKRALSRRFLGLAGLSGVAWEPTSADVDNRQDGAGQACALCLSMAAAIRSNRMES